MCKKCDEKRNRVYEELVTDITVFVGQRLLAMMGPECRFLVLAKGQVKNDNDLKTILVGNVRPSEMAAYFKEFTDPAGDIEKELVIAEAMQDAKNNTHQ